MTPLDALLSRVAEAPQRWDFHALLRAVEALDPSRPRLGQGVRPEGDALRLGQEPSVAFAPAMLAGLRREDGAAPRLLVHFLGLFGPDGPLPLHLTEYARDRMRNERDPTLARFADMFHHRMLSLFHRAWARVRPTVAFDRPAEDRFAAYAGALAGLGTPALRGRDAMPDLAKLHFAGLLANQTRHAEGLSAMLSAFFTVPVAVECFVGSWLRLEPGDHTRLGGGGAAASLGGGALLGARVWSRQEKFRVVCGPLSLPEYERLLPGGPSFRTLVPIVRNHAGDVLAWDVRFVLRAAEVPDTRLGRYGRLGWTTWLKPRRATADADDLVLDASAEGMARSAMTTSQRETEPA